MQEMRLALRMPGFVADTIQSTRSAIMLLDLNRVWHEMRCFRVGSALHEPTGTAADAVNVMVNFDLETLDESVY